MKFLQTDVIVLTIVFILGVLVGMFIAVGIAALFS
jgi:hypothetical protein